MAWECGPELHELLEQPDLELNQTVHRLVNGTADSTHSAVVALIQKSTGLPLCSGTLVTRRAILTAGHCQASWEQSGLSLTDDFGVFIGNVYMKGAQLLPIAKGMIHPEFVMTSTGIKNDIGLVFLSEDIEGIPPTPFAIPTEGKLTDQTVTFVAFGCTGPNFIGGGTRRSGPQLVKEVTPLTFVTDTPPGQEIHLCNGDSGGPALFDFGAGEKIVGIGSYTDSPQCDGIAVMTRVDAFSCFVAESVMAPLPIKIDFKENLDGTEQKESFDLALNADFFNDLSKVELWVDDQLTDSLTAAPWLFHVAVLKPGDHTLTAKAYSGTCGYGEATIQVHGAKEPDVIPPKDPPKDSGPPEDLADDSNAGCQCFVVPWPASNGLVGVFALCLIGVLVRRRR